MDTKCGDISHSGAKFGLLQDTVQNVVKKSLLHVFEWNIDSMHLQRLVIAGVEEIHISIFVTNVCAH